MQKKGDKIILLVIAVIFVAYLGYTAISRLNKDRVYAVIEVNGQEQEEIELVPKSKERIVEIKQKDGQVNIIRIKDGKAKMIEANCPDKFCLHMPETNVPSMNIVCLPNKVIIKVRGGNEDLDSIVR